MARPVTLVHSGPLPGPIRLLEALITGAGSTLVHTAFAHSFFIDPEAVRVKTPMHPNHARKSREHYPGRGKGDKATWKRRRVTLDDNRYAQDAWKKYTGCPIARRSGYGVRHIWGNPWDPNAYTAGWNLCYMPFWLGMLTESQHPHPLLEKAIRQASYDLYFRKNPVCPLPPYVEDPGLNLRKLLGEQPIRILSHKNSADHGRSVVDSKGLMVIKRLRADTRKSWSSLSTAVRLLLGENPPLKNSKTVLTQAKSIARRMARETGLSLPDLLDTLSSLAAGASPVTRSSRASAPAIRRRARRAR